MQEYKLFINGEWTETQDGEIVDDINPANGEVFARVHQAGPKDVELAISAAKNASNQWAATPPAAREAVLLKAADILQGKIEEIAMILIEEAGSTFGKAMFESSFVVNLLRSAAGESRRIFGETMPSDGEGLFSMSIRRPLGVIAGIAPFNFPFLLACKKVALALAAGNTFILKPSEETAVTGLKIAEIFEQAGLPKGVLNVVPGEGKAVGGKLVEDPRINMITFTGSTAVGKQLAVQAARNLKKITLELGGKSPLIVLADADIDYAVDAACFGIFLHQGQVCMANSRIIVQSPVYEEFCEKFVAKVKQLKVGDPAQPDTVIGPLIRASQCQVIDKHVEDAVAKGARILTGGSNESNFYQPTVIADVNTNMQIHNEESFGPLVSIIKVENHQEGLTVANDSNYGLSAAVITNDLQKAMELSMGLESGMVHINNCTVFDEPHVPFGGVKQSGFGREGGSYSMEEMTEVKWITIQMGKRHFPF